MSRLVSQEPKEQGPGTQLFGFHYCRSALPTTCHLLLISCTVKVTSEWMCTSVRRRSAGGFDRVLIRPRSLPLHHPPIHPIVPVD